MNKCYSELIKLKTFKERYEYLKTNSSIGVETFGYSRIFNQSFYHSKEWIRVKNIVISRDNGCDLGIETMPIFGKIIVHHIVPITLDDLRYSSDKILNPEFLISTSLDTHNAIHYGNECFLIDDVIERKKNDTSPWLN